MTIWNSRPDSFHALAIFPHVPTAQPCSRTDLNLTIRNIKNKQPVIDKSEKRPELDPDVRIVHRDYRGVFAVAENSSEPVKAGHINCATFPLFHLKEQA